ncbi:MAG: hypothetical protein ABIG60_03075 [Patescibacteria group bacterium]
MKGNIVIDSMARYWKTLMRGGLARIIKINGSESTMIAPSQNEKFSIKYRPTKPKTTRAKGIIGGCLLENEII